MDFTQSLPKEISWLIFRCLPIIDIVLSCSRVSKFWNKLLNEDTNWKHLFQRDFSILPITQIEDWKKEYIYQFTTHWDPSTIRPTTPEIKLVLTNNNRTATYGRGTDKEFCFVASKRRLSPQNPYFEVQLESPDNSGLGIGLVAPHRLGFSSLIRMGYSDSVSTEGVTTVKFNTGGYVWIKDKFCSVRSYTRGDIPGIFVDYERKQIHIYVNRKYIGTPDFSSEVSLLFEGELYPGLNCYSKGDSMTLLRIGKPPEEPIELKMISF